MAMLYTIGYEGFTPTSWIEAIVGHGIEGVIDVREVPHSRKPGFSKCQLEQNLEAQGVEYLHIPALGNPRAYRDALRGGLDFATFTKMFAALLDGKSDTLNMLAERVTRQRVCLLCYEEDPERCHRSLVAERLRRMCPGLVEICHLRKGDPTGLGALSPDATTL